MFLSFQQERTIQLQEKKENEIWLLIFNMKN